MLYAFGFSRIGVLASDLYFVDPEPGPGQEGAERGVRLEVRLLERGELHGSRYSAQPIEVGQPVWRADLLETVDGPLGSLNRAHHHPRFRDWEPGSRNFDPDMTADPVQWVGRQLADLDGLLERAGVPRDDATADDAKAVRERLPQITDAVRGLLQGVKDGELGLPPVGDGDSGNVRASWL